jgi:3-hydroxyisobutyrate dehydrogenase-like beta-hydroxyacid dehydrogenase
VPSSREYENGFASQLTLKNMNEAVETASKVGINAPLSARSKEVYKEVVRKGYGEKDFSIVYDLLRKKEI